MNWYMPGVHAILRARELDDEDWIKQIQADERKADEEEARAAAKPKK